jgi:hypothetical protein
MKKPELYGVSELAERWGISRQRAFQITTDQVARGRLGPPAELKCGRVWTLRQIQEFEAKRSRETGKHLP